MEKHSTQVYFSLRESKTNREGYSPIEVSISTNGERIYFSTGKKCKASDWNKTKQLVRGKDESARLINDYLTALRNKIFQKELLLMERGFLITPSLLKDAVNDKVEAISEKSLMQVYNDFIDTKRPMVGKGVAPDTFYAFGLSGR